MDYRRFEEDCFQFLKTKFDQVKWLSKDSVSSVDFECIKDNIPLMIECKFTYSNKIRLLPSQKNVDGIVYNGKEGIEILWKNDFAGKVIMDKMCLIKISEEMKIRLEKIKLIPRETFNQVIERILIDYK